MTVEKQGLFHSYTLLHVQLQEPQSTAVYKTKHSKSRLQFRKQATGIFRNGLATKTLESIGFTRNRNLRHTYSYIILTSKATTNWDMQNIFSLKTPKCTYSLWHCIATSCQPPAKCNWNTLDTCQVLMQLQVTCTYCTLHAVHMSNMTLIMKDKFV